MSCACQRFAGVRLALQMRAVVLRAGLSELGSASSRVEVARREYLERDLLECAEVLAMVDEAQRKEMEESTCVP